MHDLSLLPLPEPLVRCEGPLAEKITHHQTACEKLAADEAALERRRAGLAQELFDGGATAKTIDAARREILDQRLSLHRAAIARWQERSNLCRQAASALADAEAAAEKELETARAKVAKQLGKSGYSPEADPQFSANPEAARHRFQTQVDQAPEIRELRGRLQEISGAQRAAPKASRFASDQAAGAEQRLMKEYARLVS